MKKTYLLIFLCCTYNINILCAEKKKESITEKQNRAAKELIDYLSKQEYEQKERDRKIKEQKQKYAENHTNKIIKHTLEDNK